MVTGRGSIEMPIAAAVTAVLIFTYVFLVSVRRVGKWLGSLGLRRGPGAGPPR
jgi:hypothetical protein